MPTRRPNAAGSTATKREKAVESLFFSRDESWLRFNQRVLEEAQDATNPLLERVKFLAITASNLDEFIEIRVASFLQRIEDGYNLAQPPDEGGLRPQERLNRLSEQIDSFVHAQYRCWNEQLIPAMAEQGVRVLQWSELDDKARKYALTFYENEVDPMLTPVTIDPSHPFPRVLNKALCIALLLRYKRKGTNGGGLERRWES
jgi:polyphosphate kinase